MNKELEVDSLDYLFNAILSLDNLKECEEFFKDLCTKPELKALSQRLLVAKMLDERHIYNDIVNATGASTATISRVNRALNDGEGGLKKAIDWANKNAE